MHTIFKDGPEHPTKLWFGLPSWLLAGVLAVFALGVLAIAIRTERRENLGLERSLTDRGVSIIHALEAGGRSNPAGGESENAAALTALAGEFALQDGVAYITVTDAEGRILASGDPELVGSVFQLDAPAGGLSPAPRTRRRQMDGREIFEVYCLFDLFPGGRMSRMGMGMGRGRMGMGMGHMGRGHGMMMRHAPTEAEAEAVNERRVFVGLDPEPAARALAGDFYPNILVWCLVAALGWAGFISLFWAHHYQSSRKMLRTARTIASEVVSSLPLGLIARAPDGRVAMANASALELLRLPPEKVVGRQLSGIDGLDWDVLLARLTQGQRSLECEAELASPGQPAEPVHLGISRIETGEGLLIGHLFVIHAVGEIKRLQAEVERSRRLSAIGDLAAGVAHEIRNPLSSIKGLAVYLSRRAAPGSSEEEAARTMAGEVDRLNRVVSGLLDFARPEEMEKRPADINEIMSGALRLARADIEAKGLSAEFTPDPALAPALADGGKLTQAILNLILNAAQAAPQGGRVGLKAARDKSGLVLSVSDNGPGIPDDVRAAMFTPYFTTRPDGTGLGLAIVHRIVEGHGGRIAVKSSPGAGSEFAITIPEEKS